MNALSVWVDQEKAGILAREGRNLHVFDYLPEAVEPVSLTMPVRLQSWVTPELHPVFQMNLPEGALLEAIRKALAKIVGEDDLSILQATGGNQIGRNRFATVNSLVPAQTGDIENLDEILAYPDTRELFHELVNRYALRSGVSGVQPKILLDATRRGTVYSAGYIVKSWGSEYPCLAANEFFCMTTARIAGLAVPEFHLAENGGLFVMRRFDRTPEGGAIGFEDMCSLQGCGTNQKYASSYERAAKTLKHYVSAEHLPEARRQFFATLVLSAMLRNGDAHLKNFGVLYRSPRGPVTLAPVFDLVTTAAYLQHDVPALSLAGSKKWWPRKTYETFAVAHLALTVGEISEIIARMADAVMQTRQMLPGYIGDHPEFRGVGEAMAGIWETGVREMTR
jgi:serine/threonine-protein kinase HipA